jgi:protein TonB
MKNILLFIIFFLNVNIFSQETRQTEDLASKEYDVSAEYEDGVDKFRKKFQKHFDSKNEFKGSGTYETLITFIVDEDDSIIRFFAAGKNDTFNTLAITAIKKIRGKWNPATLNGKPVKSRYKLPLIMTFN